LRSAFDGEDSLLKEDDVESYVVQPKTGVFCPFGFAAICSPVPDDVKKGACGKFVVLHLAETLLAKPVVEKLRREIYRSWSRLFEANTEKPWNSYKESMHTWMDAWKPA
jgi:hypothetical protein